MSDWFTEWIDNTYLEQLEAEKECRIKGHLITQTDNICDRCGRHTERPQRKS